MSQWSVIRIFKLPLPMVSDDGLTEMPVARRLNQLRRYAFKHQTLFLRLDEISYQVRAALYAEKWRPRNAELQLYSENWPWKIPPFSMVDEIMKNCEKLQATYAPSRAEEPHFNPVAVELTSQSSTRRVLGLSQPNEPIRKSRSADLGLNGFCILLTCQPIGYES
ncbi:hypothetical protein TWF217_011252 [Orbilia oligospora]|nr:hypothetical protein TWF751_001468 [Orbilia oligospora]KAF3240093.1 hypothetical protein TWF128_011358 [Orbilia oligospora]KAF3243329.1 hypothetical protein TWF217_011252 [Orbilia oligospora]KAF3296316.1 hypothetical protein TWF132_010914 [Orbilia oligospora]